MTPTEGKPIRELVLEAMIVIHDAGVRAFKRRQATDDALKTMRRYPVLTLLGAARRNVSDGDKYKRKPKESV